MQCNDEHLEMALHKISYGRCRCCSGEFRGVLLRGLGVRVGELCHQGVTVEMIQAAGALTTSLPQSRTCTLEGTNTGIAQSSDLRGCSFCQLPRLPTNRSTSIIGLDYASMLDLTRYDRTQTDRTKTLFALRQTQNCIPCKGTTRRYR